MADEARDYLIRQFATAWRLTTFHLDGLTADDLRSTERTRRAVPGSSVRWRRGVGQCLTHEKLSGDRLRPIPLGRQYSLSLQQARPDQCPGLTASEDRFSSLTGGETTLRAS